MKALLIMSPILAYAIATALALLYVLLVLVPRLPRSGASGGQPKRSR